MLESAPPQYQLRVVSGLPKGSGCSQFNGYEIRRSESNDIEVIVTHHEVAEPDGHVHRRLPHRGDLRSPSVRTLCRARSTPSACELGYRHIVFGSIGHIARLRHFGRLRQLPIFRSYSLRRTFCFARVGRREPRSTIMFRSRLYPRQHEEPT